MSALDDIKKAANYVVPAISALEAIAAATGLGGPVAGTALHVIDAIVHSFLKGVTDGTPPAEILAEIERLRTSLAANDAAADAALGRRYPVNNP